ncbi:MAG: hypothetical protein K2X63_09220 [Burkholderiaceae bacterium]|nr:hypothetical protein [Burkholderiaceae bacterium]
MAITEEKRQFLARLIEITNVLGYPERGRQTMLAKHYKVTQGACRKWFAGEAMPIYEIQRDLCVRASYNYEWLMTGRGEKKFSSVPYHENDVTLTKIVHIAESLSEYKKNLVLNFISSIATSPEVSDSQKNQQQASLGDSVEQKTKQDKTVAPIIKPGPTSSK